MKKLMVPPHRGVEIDLCVIRRLYTDRGLRMVNGGCGRGMKRGGESGATPVRNARMCVLGV